MKTLLFTLSLVIGVGVALFSPVYGPSSVLICTVLAFLVGLVIYHAAEERKFLLNLFLAGLLLRVTVGTIIFIFDLHGFFGPDAYDYDELGYALLQSWQGEQFYQATGSGLQANSGMIYMVAAIYSLVGRNMLAVQFVNAVIGAATAPIIVLCALQIFQNKRVARLSGVLAAVFPSLVLWSSFGLKDGFVVFFLAMSMFATLRLGEKWRARYVVLLVCALLGLISFRFYIFYMAVVAIGGALIIGMRPLTTESFVRQFMVIMAVGLAMTYVGVIRTASVQLETYGDLKAVQRSRFAQATTAESGFGKDVDVSNTTGALSVVPIGLLYFLFAPFPWQLANLRQSITLPEMLMWWASFPLLILGIWFTIKYRLRQAIPIVVLTTMLTLAYSVYQGNIGTAYRQRAQLLVFYFIFVAVGIVLFKEKRDDRRQLELARKQAEITGRFAQKT